jgi:hypothetical protein
MKDHVKVEEPLHLYASVEALIEQLQDADSRLADASIENLSWGGDPDYAIVGWRPMNEKELYQAENKRRVAKESARRKKEQEEAAERAEYERLKAKFS